MKAIVIIALVLGVLAALLLTLRSSRNVGLPGADVLDRAQKRAREQAAAEEDD